jgi:hypothetical protein
MLLNVLKALVQDLENRGGIEFSEWIADATFASSKKGAVELVRRSAAKGPRSWQSRIAAVFLSPSGPEALRLTRAASWKGPGRKAHR